MKGQNHICGVLCVDVNEQANQMKKEDAIDILDRIIGFINNCDNKTSIMLGVFGAIIALVFSTDGVTEITRIVETAFAIKSFCNILFLMIWSSSFVILLMGVTNFALSLLAKIDCSDMKQTFLELDSNIFFENIAKNSTYKLYKEKILSVNEESLLNDFVSQIYINSCICTAKFKRYNHGLKLSLIGYGAFIALWAIGSYLY